MAEILKDEKSTEKFPREPCDKKLLLGSLRDYAPEGAEMGVDKLLTPKMTAFGKVSLNAILSITGEMEQCRLYDLDGEGQYQYVDDPMTGEQRIKVKVGNGHMATVFFPFYAVPKGENGELDEKTPLLVTPGTSSYSLFKEAMIESEFLPSDMGNQSFMTDYAELKEALEGFTFKGFYATGGSKNKFDYLRVERL